MKLRKLIALTAALFFSLSTFFVPAAQAAMIGTQDYAQALESDWDKAQLKAMFEREEIKQQLQAMGVEADEVQARIDALNAEELAQLNHNLEQLPAGGADILSLAVLVFIVFVVTDVLGATDIFPFIDPIDL